MKVTVDPVIFKAALLGNAGAQSVLGGCYERGDGVEKDLERAFMWYSSSAEQGYLDAIYNLARCYENGIGVAKDQERAFSLCEKAATEGHELAQITLGNYFSKGIGTPQSLSEGIKWYRKAAMNGSNLAQTILGDRYATGEGVPKDEIEAYALYNIASVSFDSALERREELEKSLPASARIRGQSRSRQLLKEIAAKKASK
jgi:TPR repeat protein